MGGKEGGSVNILSFSPPPDPAGMSLDHGREIGGVEKPGGFQNPRRFLAFCPAHQLGWGRLHPRRLMSPFMHSLLSLGRLMTVHSVPSVRLCGSWVGEEEDLRRSQGWTGTRELSKRDGRKD